MLEWEQVVLLSRDGKTRDEICEIMGKSMNRVYELARYARGKGYDIRFHKPTERVFIYNELLSATAKADKKARVQPKAPTTKGAFLLEGLPREVINWAAESIPAGGNLIDFVRSLIVDAYHEEVTSSTATPGSRSQGAPEGLTEH
jgi:hypothetical protein